MKLLFSLVKMVLLICWKILKIICGPMKDSLVHIGKAIWEAIKERYNKRKEAKATAAERADKDSEDGKSATSARDEVSQK